MNTMDFRKIRYGKTDAIEESRSYPNLLTEGYFDVDSVAKQAIYDNTFLFLGYKGSGKTALSEHLKLMVNDNIRVDAQSLKDFPYKTFGKLISGDVENETKYKLTWRWLLLVLILKNLVKDEDATCEKASDLKKTIEILTQAGVFSVISISDLVKKTSSNTFKAEIANFAYSITTQKENASLSLEWMVGYIKDLILEFTGMRKHIVIIDGLDEILTSKEIQYQAIAAMINEVRDLNTFFGEHNRPIKICVLCRTDIFERLPDPNKNKIRRDCSYSFNWYREGSDSAADSGLVKIANIRTSLVYPDVNDMFSEFFPDRYKGQEIRTFMLDCTRHTPRDFLQLLVSIQKHCRTCKVDKRAIDSGVAEFSIDYFLPEIKDEMAGYIDFKHIDTIVNLIGSFHSRFFTFAQFSDAVASSPTLKDIDSKEVMRILYDCSAIGHEYPSKDGEDKRFAFKFRNRNTSFNLTDRIVLHKGLWKALNVNF